jgi:hypothetical protein
MQAPPRYKGLTFVVGTTDGLGNRTPCILHVPGDADKSIYYLFFYMYLSFSCTIKWLCDWGDIESIASYFWSLPSYMVCFVMSPC